MTSTLAFYRDDREDDAATPGPASRRERKPAEETLARFTVEAALTSAQRRRIGREGSLALIVDVPSGEWVEPIRTAIERENHWSVVYARSGSSKSEDRPDRGNERVASCLSNGGRVLGVSQGPERYLPSTLRIVADLRLRVDVPSNEVIARVIRAATGRSPGAMPARIASGLDYAEIVSAIRTHTTADSCVQRLVAAAKAKALVDDSVTAATPFNLLRGFGSAHTWGTRLIDEIEQWRQGNLDFDQIDRHAVLSSDPGLGKTSFVKSLAKSANLPLITTSAASWFASSNGYLDGVIKQVDAAFSNASAMAPAILFIDELDGIPNRATMSDRAREWWTPLVTHILLTIDEANASKVKICMIGATNYGDKLDAALIRPGRLTRLLTIKRPSATDLAEIVRQHLGDDLPDLDLLQVGELGAGATGAQAAGWVKEARTTARAAGRPMRPVDLLGVVAPADSRTPQALRRSAIHESGHALALDRLLVGRVDQVTLVARDGAAGATLTTSTMPSSPTRDEIERHVVTLLAGRAAEIVILGAASAGAGGADDSDLGLATRCLVGTHASYGLGASLTFRGSADELIRDLRFDSELRASVESDLKRLQAEAERFVADHRHLIETVAEHLVAKRVLSGDALRAIIAADRIDSCSAKGRAPQ